MERSEMRTTRNRSLLGLQREVGGMARLKPDGVSQSCIYTIQHDKNRKPPTALAATTPQEVQIVEIWRVKDTKVFSVTVARHQDLAGMARAGSFEVVSCHFMHTLCANTKRKDRWCCYTAAILTTQNLPLTN